ncbi:CU044_2847 family protein [Streptomyces sp. NPDC058457]|uniref:CU044_2847 family protein n=1 Tax=Streptomyces sp. NPDC058457 TaxID=3346507 RepID=UPI00365F7C42
MVQLARIALEDGCSILVEAPVMGDGPVKAGRIGDVVRDLPESLQEALSSVSRAARTALDELRKAAPDEITVEFGVDLAVEAGAVITKSSANSHLKVAMTWKSAPGHSDGSD